MFDCLFVQTYHLFIFVSPLFQVLRKINLPAAQILGAKSSSALLTRMTQKSKKSESFQNLKPDAKGGHFFVTLFWEIFYDTFYGQNLEPDAKVGHVHLIPLHFGSCSMFSSAYFRISYNNIVFVVKHHHNHDRDHDNHDHDHDYHDHDHDNHDHDNHDHDHDHDYRDCDYYNHEHDVDNL